MMARVVMLILSVGSILAIDTLKPVSVKLLFKNWKTFIVWEPGDGHSNSTFHYVEYKVYGSEEWRRKKECVGFNMTSCDITGDLEDLRNLICGRVMAVNQLNSSGWVETHFFTPLMEMVLDAPQFELVPGTNYLQLQILPSYENNKDIKWKEYVVDVRSDNGSPKMKLIFAKRMTERDKIISDLNPGEGYCVSVKSLFQMNYGQEILTMSKEICKHTKKDHRQNYLIVHVSLGLTLTSLILPLLGAFIWRHKLLQTKEVLPKSLIISPNKQKTSQYYINQKQDGETAYILAGNEIGTKTKANKYVCLAAETGANELPKKFWNGTSHAVIQFAPHPTTHGPVCVDQSNVDGGQSPDSQPTVPDGTVCIEHEYWNTHLLGKGGIHGYSNVLYGQPLTSETNGGLGLNKAEIVTLVAFPVHTDLVQGSECLECIKDKPAVVY